MSSLLKKIRETHTQSPNVIGTGGANGVANEKRESVTQTTERRQSVTNNPKETQKEERITDEKGWGRDE